MRSIASGSSSDGGSARAEEPLLRLMTRAAHSRLESTGGTCGGRGRKRQRVGGRGGGTRLLRRLPGTAGVGRGTYERDKHGARTAHIKDSGGGWAIPSWTAHNARWGVLQGQQSFLRLARSICIGYCVIRKSEHRALCPTCLSSSPHLATVPFRASVPPRSQPDGTILLQTLARSLIF